MQESEEVGLVKRLIPLIGLCHPFFRFHWLNTAGSYPALEKKNVSDNTNSGKSGFWRIVA